MVLTIIADGYCFFYFKFGQVYVLTNEMNVYKIGLKILYRPVRAEFVHCMQFWSLHELKLASKWVITVESLYYQFICHYCICCRRYDACGGCR